jgi:hypothetical protein
MSVEWPDLEREEQLIRIWRQHLDFERQGYDGHNRRSGLVTMRRLSLRRLRRRWNRRLNLLVHHRGGRAEAWATA